MSHANTLLIEWSHHCHQAEDYLVLPDGCCDVIVLTDVNGESRLKLADWDFRPRPVQLPAGMHLRGYRLRPGVIIDPDDLAGMPTDAASLPACIEASVRPNETQGELIASLACAGDDGARVARQAGVSQRTLQRHFAATGLPPPDYWRRLGRARRAANGLLAFPEQPLVELAADHGYADQAHMTREFVRWFGLSPVRLRHSPHHRFLLPSAGLGNWRTD